MKKPANWFSLQIIANPSTGFCMGGLLFLTVLTLSWRRSLSYKNQSIDLQSKSMDWFLYGRDLRLERVKKSKYKIILGECHFKCRLWMSF